jgi:hypothetical protein
MGMVMVLSFRRSREKIGGGRRILGTGDFVERVLSESGEPAGQDSASSFRDGGAIGKGVRNVLGRCGAIIGWFHIGHFQEFA